MMSNPVRSLGALTAALPVLLVVVLLGGCQEKEDTGAMEAGPASEYERVELARTYADEGKYKEAVIEFKNALAIAPENAATRALLGDVYLRMGQADAAENELRRAKEMGAKRELVTLPMAEALLLLGREDETLRMLGDASATEGLPPERLDVLRGDAHFSDGDYDSARAAFESVLLLAPESEPALRGLARIAVARKEYDDARDLIARALAADEASVEARLLLGRVEFEQQRYDAARQVFDEAMGRATTEGLTWFEVLSWRARTLIEVGELAAAERDLQALKGGIRQANPRVSLIEGMLRLKQGRLDAAQTAFEEVLKMQADDVPAKLYLGSVHFAKESFEQAAEYLSRYLAAVPNDPWAAKLLARARLRLGDVPGARAAVAPLLASGAENLSDPETLELIGQISLRDGRIDEGKDYLAKAVESNPESADLLTRTGLTLLQTRDVDQAVEVLDRAVQQDPDSFVAQVALVGGHLQAKRFQEAVSAALEMQERWPDRPEPPTFLGVSYGLQGDRAKARAAFERAVEIEPQYISAASNLAALATADGDFDAAREQYERILAYEPGDVRTLVKLAKLERAAGDLEAHERRLEQALAAEPDALQARVLLAGHYVQTNNPLRALAVLNEVRDAYSEQPGFLAALAGTQLAAKEIPSAARSANSLARLLPREPIAQYLLARVYAAAEDFEGLRAQLRIAFNLDPDNAAAGPLMRRLATLAPDIRAARAAIGDLKAVDPTHPDLIDLEAQIAMRDQRPDLALEVYGQAREREPTERRWVMRIAQVQQASGRDAEGARTLETWVEANPTDRGARLLLAKGYLHMGQQDQARAHFEKLLEMTPDDPSVLNNVAYLSLTDDPARSLELARRAVQLRRDWIILDTLGMALAANGLGADAAAALREAAEINPASAQIQVNLAAALAQTGDGEAARQVLNGVMAMDGEPDAKEQARTLLERIEER